MDTRRRQIRRPLVLVALVALSLTALGGAAQAQTDPYTGGGVTTGGGTSGGVRPSISLNLTETSPGARVRLSGCNFNPGQFLRVTLNPGTTQNPGTPCAGAPRPNQNALGDAVVQRAGIGRTGLERLRFEQVAQAANNCAYNAPWDSDAPDTTAGGGIASSKADGKGCLDTWVSVPANLTPGMYELCGSTTGLETVCATLRLTAANESVASRGFARTGIAILPWVIGALLAIIIGRRLVQRSRRTA